MRDDIDFNIEFCQLIEKYPELYDFNRSDYCNRHVQDKAWELIAKKLNESTQDCRERWKNIRGRYGKVYKAKVLHSGLGAKKVKEYYLGSHLQFLNQFLKYRPRKIKREKRKIDTDDNSTEEDEESNSSFAQRAERNSNSTVTASSSPLPSTSAATLINRDQPTFDFVSAKTEISDSYDYDLDFFKSLIPDMMAMTPEQKRRFKIGVLKLAGQILEEN